MSKREREVFEVTVRGLSNAEIAERLFISQRTAETHRYKVVRKFAATSLADAIRIGASYRVLEPGFAPTR